jgi:LacI family transcriptional regulator
MGYDGIEIGRYMVTPLTTIAQPFTQIGKTGIQVLLERIRDPKAPAR